MKNNKRALAIITSALMAVTSMAVTGMNAFADDVYDITVTATHATTSEFEAYQIFSGGYSGDKLTNIQWGSSMTSADKSALLTELQGNDIFKKEGTNVFAGLGASSTAEDYANAMAEISSESAPANELAKILGKYVSGAVTDADTSTKNVIDDVSSGYYLVKEKTAASEENPISLNLLKVVGADASINAKEDLPSLTKEIDEKGGVAANTASVGDVVPFIIKSRVPDMTGYTKYFFVLNDTLSAGLTYNDDISITVGGDTVAAEDYSVTKTGTTNLEIVFKDFYGNYNDDTNDEIVVKYTATVNNNADMTQAGNVNTAQLTYSNNPNETATPDSTNTDKPGPGAPTGQTPQIKTVTYVTQIDILKTKADGSTPLAGATFTLDGYLKTAVASSGEYFVKTDGSEAAGTETYYRLNDGTYKLVSEFVAGTDEYYDSTTTTYKKVAASAVPETSKIHKEVTTTSDGKINFAGLGEGTYIITETAAPGGSNKLEQPITVVITASGVTITGCTWNKTVTDPNGATTAGDFVQGDATTQSKLPMTIVNREGSALPSTGGIGTKLFYLFGSLLVAGSVVLLVTKKRMAVKEN